MLWWKRNVFRFFLKAGNDSESLRSSGRLKQCYSEEQTKILEHMNEVNAQFDAKVTKRTGCVADPVFETTTL